MKVQLTDMEKQTLHDFTQDDFYESGLDSVLWADNFLDFSSYNSKQTRGILSSLVKKGIIKPILKGRDGVICLTELGKEVMRALGIDS